MMKNQHDLFKAVQRGFVCIGLAGAATVAAAQSAPVTTGPNVAQLESGEKAEIVQEGDGYQSGAFRIYPSIDFRAAYDANVTSQSDNTTGSYVYTLSPAVALIAGDPYHQGQVGLKMQVDFVSYMDSSEDDYVDWVALLDYDWEPTESLSLYAGLQYLLGHEARGEEALQGDWASVFSEPSEFEEWGLIASVGYEFTSKDRWDLDLIHEERQYNNNYSVTQARERTVDRARLALNHRIHPNTSVEISGAVNRYDYWDSDYDSNQYNLMASAIWDLTYQTQGFAGVGWGWKDMDAPSLTDTSSAIWRVGVNWKPLSYSTFTVETSQRFEESDGWGDHLMTRFYGVNWNHLWYPRFSSDMGVGLYEEEYVDSDPFRDDEVLQYHIRLNYSWREWMGLYAGVRHVERTSNLGEYSYDDDIVELGVNLNLGLSGGLSLPEAFGDFVRTGSDLW